MKWRLEEDPRLQALTGMVIGDAKSGPRAIAWIVSAGELLDEVAHREILKRGSSAEACALHGGTRFWKGDQ